MKLCSKFYENPPKEMAIGLNGLTSTNQNKQEQITIEGRQHQRTVAVVLCIRNYNNKKA
jgi:hypothetical protein